MKYYSSSDGEIYEIIGGKVCFAYTKKNANYIAMVDADKNVETSVAIDSKYELQAITDDGKYGMFFTSGFDDYDLFTIDLKTGESTVSEGDAGSCKGKNYFVTKDLKNPENIYLMYGVRIYMLDDNGGAACKVDGKSYIDVNSYKYWFVDGFFVDDSFECYEIN